ncbi:MAG: tetratricopeptide repeat protein [Candidatus Hinthialibacter antarcticus]|nr:tetratricopeptide repeat protein [Candidatus Hinthialibacter antarcticus]
MILRKSGFMLAPFVVGLIALNLLLNLDVCAFDWIKDPDEAFKRSKDSGKPVMMYFYHPFSLREDNKVFTNALVQRYSDKLIAVQINIDSNGDLASRFNVYSLPAVLFFDEKERELISFRYEAEKLLRTRLVQRIKQTIANIDEFTLVESQVETLKDNPDFLYRYARGLRDRGLFKEADSHFQRLFEHPDASIELKQKAKTAFLSMLILQATQHLYSQRYDAAINQLQRLIDKVDVPSIVYQSQYLLGTAYWEAGDKKKAESTLKKLIRDKKSEPFASMAKRFLEEKEGKR